jgi:iron(III) transport system substrate-binding protein
MRLWKLALGLVAVALIAPAAPAAELVVYSARNEQLIKPLFDAYQAKTGTTFKLLTDKEAPLVERLKAEGAATPASLLVTVDAGNLWHAAQEGVLAAVESPALQTNVPAHLRDSGNQWFGLSQRARVMVYNTSKLKPADLSTYEDLADKKWQGRLCLRSSKKVYNQSLVAMMMARLGAEKAGQVVKGWVANLAAEPFADDTKAMEAVAAGVCDVTLVNTYYYGRLMKKSPELPLAIAWPGQGVGESGVHVNVSGAGVTKHAPQRDAAVKFLEWLSDEEAQAIFGSLNMEYPVNPRVKPDAATAAWGGYRTDTAPLSDAGRLQAEAVKLMDRAGYK